MFRGRCMDEFAQLGNDARNFFGSTGGDVMVSCVVLWVDL